MAYTTALRRPTLPPLHRGVPARALPAKGLGARLHALRRGGAFKGVKKAAAV